MAWNLWLAPHGIPALTVPGDGLVEEMEPMGS